MQWMYPCEYFSRLASTGREGMKREEADGHGTEAGIEEEVELFCSAALQCKLDDSLFLLAAELGHCLTPPPRGEAVGLLCSAVHCKLHSLPPFDSSRKLSSAPLLPLLFSRSSHHLQSSTNPLLPQAAACAQPQTEPSGPQPAVPSPYNPAGSKATQQPSST